MIISRLKPGFLFATSQAAAVLVQAAIWRPLQSTNFNTLKFVDSFYMITLRKSQ
jgi:hypothetical protein